MIIGIDLVTAVFSPKFIPASYCYNFAQIIKVAMFHYILRHTRGGENSPITHTYHDRSVSHISHIDISYSTYNTL